MILNGEVVFSISPNPATVGMLPVGLFPFIFGFAS